jgi:short-subunit dehydrogenase
VAVPTVIITGASMGIGRALALAWAGRGATVVLSARGADRLDVVAEEVRTAGGRAIVVPGDVTVAADREALIARAVHEGGGIDVLVNNAGRGFYSPVLQIDFAELRELFELNVIAPLALMQTAAEHLERTRGTIVMMSSLAGVIAPPRFAGYGASKFALEAITMAARAELAPRGITVVVIRPGPVRTPFRANAMRSPGLPGYDAPDPRSQDPRAVADMTLRAVDRGTAVVETTPYAFAASLAARFAPPALRLALRRMAAKDG